jgi:hypothetical protein
VTADRDTPTFHDSSPPRVPAPAVWWDRDDPRIHVSARVIEAWWEDTRRHRVRFKSHRARLNGRGQPSIFQWARVAVDVPDGYVAAHVRVPLDLRQPELEPGTILTFRATPVVPTRYIGNGVFHRNRNAVVSLIRPITYETAERREEERQAALAQYREYREMYGDGLPDEPRSWYHDR